MLRWPSQEQTLQSCCQVKTQRRSKLHFSPVKKGPVHHPTVMVGTSHSSLLAGKFSLPAVAKEHPVVQELWFTSQQALFMRLATAQEEAKC